MLRSNLRSTLLRPASLVLATVVMAGLAVAASATAQAAGSQGSRATRVVHATPVLAIGARGPAVVNLQLRLRQQVDGWFGRQTQTAVKRFQKAKGLRVTGVVNALTWRALPPAPRRASRSAPRVVPGTAHLNWRALARCESSGNPRAVNSGGGYYGLYQFNVGTWRSVGGSGYPHHATAQEQTYRAQLLYSRRGSSPWPHCGRLLYR